MEKKIIGFKLIKEYPRSEKIGTEVVAPSVRDVILNNDFYHMKGNYEIAVFANVINGWPEFWQPIYEEEKVIDLQYIIDNNEPYCATIGPHQAKRLMELAAEAAINFVVDFIRENIQISDFTPGVLKERLKDKIK